MGDEEHRTTPAVTQGFGFCGPIKTFSGNVVKQATEHRLATF